MVRYRLLYSALLFLFAACGDERSSSGGGNIDPKEAALAADSTESASMTLSGGG